MKPCKLKLLPGKRWEGTMRVGDQVQGGYVVDFDATVRGMATGERWVGDRCVLTPMQIYEWTGVYVAEIKPGEEATRGLLGAVGRVG